MTAAADLRTMLDDPAGPSVVVSLVLDDGTVRAGVRAVVRRCGNLPPLWLGDAAGGNRSATWAELTVHADDLAADDALQHVVLAGGTTWRVTVMEDLSDATGLYGWRIAVRTDQRLRAR